MHVVSELQRQPSKRRDVTETIMGNIHSLVIVVKYITFLVFVAETQLAAQRSFARGFWNPQGYSLSPVLEYKLSTCAYNTTRNMFAFRNVSVQLNADNQAELITDYAGQLRSLCIIAGVTFISGLVCTHLFQKNRFFLRWRHFYLHKDVLTTVDAMLLSLTFYFAIHLHEQQGLLEDYFLHCQLYRQSYIVSVSLASMFVFVGVSAGAYAIAIALLMFNVLSGRLHSYTPSPEEYLEDPQLQHADLHDEVGGGSSTTASAVASRSPSNEQHQQHYHASNHHDDNNMSPRSPLRLSNSGTVSGGAHRRSSFAYQQRRPPPLQHHPGTPRIGGAAAASTTTPFVPVAGRGHVGKARHVFPPATPAPLAPPPPTAPYDDGHLRPSLASATIAPPPPPDQSFYLVQPTG